MNKRWRRYWNHPLVVSFILSVLVIFFLARYTPRYHAELIEESKLSNNGEVYYFDMDNDGNSEKLHYYHYDRIFQPTLYLYDSNDNFKFLWNFLESPIKNCKVFAGDYNNDSLKEIFIFTEKSDSLFLYVLDSQNDKMPIVYRAFIDDGNITDSEVEIIPIGLYKLNDDVNKEFLFSVDAGFPDDPRKIFSFDISNKLIKSSPEINSGISKPILVEDLNINGKLEIIISNRSVDVAGNGSESQLIVLNNNLEFLFQPVIFHSGSSQITVQLVKTEKEKLIAVLHSGIKTDNVFNSLMLYNASGEQLNEISLKSKTNLSLLNISDDENYIYSFSGKRIIRYTSDLKKDRSFKVNKNEKIDFVGYTDVTGDLTNDLIFKGNEYLLVISDNYRNSTKLDISNDGAVNISTVKFNEKLNQLSIQVDNKWYLYDFYKNETFFYSYIFYFLIFLIITVLSLLISKLRLIIIRSKKLLFETANGDLINEIEDNIEEEFTGLKSKIKGISNGIKSDSYNLIINDIDETYKKVKTLSKNIISKDSSVVDFKNALSELIKNKESLLNISSRLFPENGFFEIENEIKDIILKLSEYCFNLITENSQYSKLVLQLIQHNDYVNLLIEIENEFIDSSNFNKNENLNTLLKKANVVFEVDNFSGFGTIINANIPLNLNAPASIDKSSKIKIIIAEDHDVSLFGLISLFKTKNDIEVIGTAKNGMEVLKMLETKQVDIVITDISMPGMDGIELSEKLKLEYPNIKIIVFTMYMENWFIEQLTQNGAMGFVSKNSKIVELVGAVRNVYDGNNYYCPQFKSKFGLKGKNNGISNKLDSLTKNELQIVKQYAENLTKEQIAQKLNVNNKTIDTFVANILLKLNAGDENEIIRIAKKQKFVSE